MRRTNNPVADRVYHAAQAKDCLIYAAAALLDAHDMQSLAAAELYAARALMHMAEADQDGQARDLAVETIRGIQASRRAEGAGG